jgi:hypothetical protein
VSYFVIVNLNDNPTNIFMRMSFKRTVSRDGVVEMRLRKNRFGINYVSRALFSIFKSDVSKLLSIFVKSERFFSNTNSNLDNLSGT